MKKNSLYITLAISALACNSCATVLSSRQTGFKVLTSEPSMLIVEQDTFKNMSQRRLVVAKRSDKPINITIVNDSLKKTVTIEPTINYVSLLNIYFWPLFFVDHISKKGYTYPKTVFIAFEDHKKTYLTYNPHDETYKKQNLLKINVLNTINSVSPAISVSYERKTDNHFATQFSVAYLLPENPWIVHKDVGSDIKGFRISLEEKYYFLEHALHRSYLGLETRFFNKKYQAVELFEEPHMLDKYEWYEDSIGIRKQVYDFNIKYGYLFRAKRFSVDFSIGLGLRHRNAVHIDRTNPLDRMVPPRHPNIYHYANREGKYWTVSMPVDIGIGWAF